MLAKVVRGKIDNEEALYFLTLEGHAEDCLKILKCYVERNEEVIRQFCKRWDLDSELFIKNLFITIYLHDIGKLTHQFQNRIKEGKHSQDYPHAFFAVPIIFNLYNKVITPLLPSDEFPLIELCSILGHHTQLYDLIYNDINTKPRFLEEQVKEFINKMPKFYRKLEFTRYFNFEWVEIEPDFDFPGNGELFDKIKSFRKVLNRKAGGSNEKIRLKSVYCFFHSILQLCDDYSSANFHDFIQNYNGDERLLGSVLENPERYVIALPDIKEMDILGGHEPYKFQEELKEKTPKFCLLFAPCGRGKTEAALIWAFEVCKRYKRNKIIFAMPTRITSNAMWERFCELLGEGETKEEKIRSGMKYVGLYHGKSFLAHGERHREERGADEDELTEEDLEEIKGENFKGNVFFKPVTITTIDHLILSFVHGFNQADFTLGNLQNAVIVFDEVHYYEKLTLEHLMSLFGILKEMDVPNLLMSGTLPDFFVKKAREINPEYFGPIEDKEGLNFKPFKVEVMDGVLINKEGINESFLDEVVETYRRGLNQFVILNTVKRSQKAYEKIKKALTEESISPNTFLLHSEFIWEDRRKKEKSLIKKLKIEKGRPVIFVSTQVMELSLDISCERMYTELAPADALGQRGGRLNRGAEQPNGAVMKIFMPEEFLMEEGNKKRPYDFELLEKTLKNLEEKEYSYSEIKEVCNRVYEGVELEEKNLKKIFNECCIFGYSPKRIAFDEEQGRLLQIRAETFKKIEVIPMDVVQDKIEKFCEKKGFELDLSFLSPVYTTQKIFDHLKNELKEDFKELRRAICSVKNEGRVPIYVYHGNVRDLEEGETEIKLFDFLQINKKWLRFTWIPYSNEVGFQYDKIVNIQPDIVDFII